MIKTSKVAFVTGAASGLGKRTVIELAKQGINVCLNFLRSEEKAKELARSVEAEYQVQTMILQGDVSIFNDCSRMVSQVVRHFGRIDILINNAGPYIFERKPLVEYDVQEWEYIINGNLNGVFYLCKLIVPIMRQNRWGRIINFGFERAETAPGWIFRSAFATAKVGVVSLTKTLAMEEAENGITINMVCPGDIAGKWKELDIHEARCYTRDDTPIGRSGTGQDIARVISFLCQEDSDFITGSVIPITGGKDVLTKQSINNKKYFCEN
ncbi:MAG TPA: SDR family oxidoreductase [Bacillota bacterium]|nr:SDR family oxidoreductase [Bacillota bacterium]